MRGGFAVPLFALKIGRGKRAVSPCTLFALLRPSLAGCVPESSSSSGPSPGSHGVRRDLKEDTVFERDVDSDAQTILAGDNQVERDNS
jgi:hypothetical protein